MACQFFIGETNDLDKDIPLLNTHTGNAPRSSASCSTKKANILEFFLNFFLSWVDFSQECFLTLSPLKLYRGLFLKSCKYIVSFKHPIVYIFTTIFNCSKYYIDWMSGKTSKKIISVFKHFDKKKSPILVKDATWRPSK